MPPRKQPTRSAPQPPANSAPEIVDPIWLLKALGALLGVGLLCAYISVCVLFYKQQWQLVLHPIRTATHSPADYGLSAETVTFGPEKQLHGWWIPSGVNGSSTVLMLPAGSGSAADSLPRAKTLQAAGLNVLLFDYRGFGPSGGQHPTEAFMEADADAALTYLKSRGIQDLGMVVYGAGAGASLATKICAEHEDLEALVLERADGDFASRAKADPRARIVPFTLLFHERFPLEERLRHLKTPKLLVYWSDQKDQPNYRKAADPKMLFELKAEDAEKAWPTALSRFLDTYFPHPPSGAIQGAP